MLITPRLDRCQILPESGTATEVELDRPRRVIVLNDPVNLMSYVVMVFRRVFGYSLGKARQHMLEVHHRDRSVLWTGAREKTEAYVHTAYPLASGLCLLCFPCRIAEPPCSGD